ncbi:methionyl-tRNA formyltransferase [Candidatus Peregrinibacteria bacterium RIFOXYC2_FULL_33_13]|nr:MAG: Methionyl-tRNA formyltransferase [Candidatus Peregrinibacteria bacterium GW2011_GWA2_33_10]KKP41169.1 MAG: methionyl-tRNA formyltransferase, methionyl-tRNA formyltransferase [Candidatus Peregrinibacteria bacterium GW2011_GWC2_33_13]OGJ53842.1 MAG: methionyl-tRNA formyltransferase [Candidatus Peregrinibacteria bacterium RIFOXYC2_FULL_33_13]
MEKRNSLILVGCSNFAANIYRPLLDFNKYNIEAIVTAPDKYAGRNKQELVIDPCKILGMEKKIPVLQPERIENIYDLLKGLRPDFLVVCSYGQILSKKVLKIPKNRSLNIHPSLLPKYRGATPIQSAIKNGDKFTGVSIIEMSEDLDAGDVVLMKREEISDTDTYETLSERLANLSVCLLDDSIIGLDENILAPLPQVGQNISYCYKFKKDAGLINFQKNARSIYDFIRGFNPEPGTFTYYNGKRLKILSAKFGDDKEKGIQGMISKVNDDYAVYGSIGFIIPLKVQLEGKNPSSFKEFVNGRKDIIGTILGK